MNLNHKFTPIFKKDNQEFIVRIEEFTGKDEEEAKHIGWGASIVECVLWDCEYTNEVRPIKGMIGREANLAGTPVFILENDKSGGNEDVKSRR